MADDIRLARWNLIGSAGVTESIEVTHLMADRACSTPGCPRPATLKGDGCHPCNRRRKPVIDPPIPILHNPGAPQQVLDELKAMSWDELVTYCDMVRAGVVDALIERLVA